jgi:hypothetical protein
MNENEHPHYIDLHNWPTSDSVVQPDNQLRKERISRMMLSLIAERYWQELHDRRTNTL